MDGASGPWNIAGKPAPRVSVSVLVVALVVALACFAFGCIFVTTAGRRRRDAAILTFDGFSGTDGKNLLQTSRSTAMGVPDGARAFLDSHPDWNYIYFDDGQVTRFLADRFPEANEVFERINPRLGAMKADVWRYAALVSFGGIYLDDKSFFPEDPWEDTSKARMFFEGMPERAIGRDIAEDNPHLQLRIARPKVRNWCLSGPRNSSFFRRALVRLVDDCNRYVEVVASMHERVLALTGPWLLTRALLDAPDAEDFICTPEREDCCSQFTVMAPKLDNPDYDAAPDNERVFFA